MICIECFLGEGLTIWNRQKVCARVLLTEYQLKSILALCSGKAVQEYYCLHAVKLVASKTWYVKGNQRHLDCLKQFPILFVVTFSNVSFDFIGK